MAWQTFAANGFFCQFQRFKRRRVQHKESRRRPDRVLLSFFIGNDFEERRKRKLVSYSYLASLITLFWTASTRSYDLQTTPTGTSRVTNWLRGLILQHLSANLDPVDAYVRKD
jgi:hypothetical protein